MQLKQCILWMTGIVFFCQLSAQEILKNEKNRIGKVEVDILSSYYEQDGDHSAVEGGIGTQSLNDKTMGIVINIPIDTINIFNLNLNSDTYTSASCDHIDGIGDNAILSTPSSKDTRIYGALSYSRIAKNGVSISIGGGFSKEFDVSSYSGLLGMAKTSENHNRELSLHVKGYYDKWLLIYPVEKRLYADTFNLPDIRKTISFDLSYAQILTKRFQALFSYELTIQKGLLSTPFHRVYFNDGTDIYSRTGSIEILPDSRIKNAFAIRTSVYPFDFIIGRFYYRYYFDTYKIHAHTFNAEIPVKITRFISVYPFYRYYVQTQAEWFRPYGEHDLSQYYFTSDYDLSALSSNKLGVGLRISPPFGIFHFKHDSYNRTSAFQSIEIRYAKYSRSDGLNSYIISSDFKFGF